jgi:hypothetical protein
MTVLHPFNIALALATRDRGMITQARIDKGLELLLPSAPSVWGNVPQVFVTKSGGYSCLRKQLRLDHSKGLSFPV